MKISLFVLFIFFSTFLNAQWSNIGQANESHNSITVYDSLLYVGGSYHLLIYDTTGNFIDMFAVDGRIESITHDSNGTVWLTNSENKVGSFYNSEFTWYDVNSGLLPGTPTDIECDDQNNIYVSFQNDYSENVEGGICMFDGNAWQTIDLGFSNIEEIKIVDIIIRDGKVWASMWYTVDDESEYAILCQNNAGGFDFYNANNTIGIDFTEIVSSYVDEDGTIWFGGDHGNLIRYDGTWEQESNSILNTYQFSIESIIVKPNNDILIGSHGALVKKTDGEWDYTLPSIDGLCFNTVYDMILINNTVWGVGSGDTYYVSGAHGGIISITGDEINSFFPPGFRAYPLDIGLAGDKVIIETSEGYSIYDGDNWNHISEISEISYEINCFKGDYDHNIWFGTDNGVYIYDGNTYTHITEVNIDGTSAVEIGAVNKIIPTLDGIVYLNSEEGLFYIENEQWKYLPIDGIIAGVVKADNVFWIIKNGEIFTYNPNEIAPLINVSDSYSGEITDNYKSIHYDMINDKIWISSNQGVVEFNNDTENIQYQEYTNADGLFNNFNYKFYQDDETLWILGRGITSYNNDVFNPIGESPYGALSSSSVVDSIGRIWFLTYDVDDDCPDQVVIFDKSQVSSSQQIELCKDIIAYPNPVVNKCNFIFDKKYIGESLFVYDIYGKTQLQEIVTNKQMTFDFSQISDGVYIIVIPSKKKGLKIIKN